MFRVATECSFSAAHHLRDYHGACERLHGHNYRVIAVIEGAALRSGGMLLDFKDLKGHLREITDAFDHADLNGVPPFDELEPTAEQIARVIALRLAERLAESLRVAEVTVYETPTAWATYRPESER